MIYLGCHLTSSKGYENMAKEAVSINADTLQFFTRNPRGGRAKAIDPEDVKRYIRIAEEHNFGKVIAHAPYTPVSYTHLDVYKRQQIRYGCRSREPQ